MRRASVFRNRSVTAVIAALLLVLTGCGGDERSVDDAASNEASEAADGAAADDTSGTEDDLETRPNADEDPSSAGAGTTDQRQEAGGDGDDGEPPQSEEDGSERALCEAAAPMLAAVPREFVGSPAHVALFDELAEVAPEELQADVGALRTHYDEAVDPSDPDSQDFVNFPQDIQRVAAELHDELSERCS